MMTTMSEMTLGEAILHAEEVAEENQRVVDTGIVFDDVTIDMLYCDDTEVIEEHLANYQKCASEHRQLAEWLKDYKRLLEQEPNTRNCFGCKYSKDNHNAGTEEYHLCMWENQYTPTPKNDLAVDAVSRQAVIDLMMQKWGENFSGDDAMQESIDAIRLMPAVTPQEPILDKIREQMKDYLRGVEITLEVLVENDPLRPKMEGAKVSLEECLELIDKAETEADNG